jgi:hypothetical protein
VVQWCRGRGGVVEDGGTGVMSLETTLVAAVKLPAAPAHPQDQLRVSVGGEHAAAVNLVPSA